MEKALSHITVLPETREQVEHFVNLCVNEALSGDYDLIKIAQHIKALEEMTKMLKTHLNDYILEDMEKHGKGDHVQGSLKFAVRHRTTIDYASTGDSKWHQLKADLSQREKFLASLKEPISQMDG
jgi:hypothetical protein